MILSERISNGTNPPVLNPDFVRFFREFDYAGLIAGAKSVLVFITWVFTFLLAVVAFKMRRLMRDKVVELEEELLHPSADAVSTSDRRWDEIRKRVNSFTEADWKLAVIEADKFVDDVLRSAGYAGETMGERLMLIQPGQLLSIQDLWDAHKLRNLLVHDPKYQVTHRQAILAVQAFEKVLTELGALS